MSGVQECRWNRRMGSGMSGGYRRHRKSRRANLVGTSVGPWGMAQNLGGLLYPIVGEVRLYIMMMTFSFSFFLVVSST